MEWQSATILSIDTETTGPDPLTARIVEIGACRVERGDLTNAVRFGSLVNPGCDVPVEASAIHGITTEKVRGEPTIADLTPRLLARVQSADVLCGYNLLRYDLPILSREIGPEWDDAIRGKPILDSLVAVKLDNVGRFWQGTGRHRLTEVVKRLGIRIRGSEHRASADAEAAVKVMFALAEFVPADALDAWRFLTVQAARQEQDYQDWKQRQ